MGELNKGTIHKVRTFKFGDFQTTSPLLYDFKQQTDVTKIIDVRFCPDPLPFPQSVRTLWMVPSKIRGYINDNQKVPALLKPTTLNMEKESYEVTLLKSMQKCLLYSNMPSYTWFSMVYYFSVSTLLCLIVNESNKREGLVKFG